MYPELLSVRKKKIKKKKMLIMIITASVADKLHKSYTYSLSCTFPPPADNTDIYLTASVDKSDDSECRVLVL